MSEARQRGWMYTRGRSQDLRDVTAKIRAIELFNPDGLSRSAPLSRFRPLCEPPALPLPACLPCLPACLPLPRPSYVGPHLLRRPRILRPACCLCPSSRFDPSFFFFFPSQRTFSVSPLSPLLGARSISFILRHHPRLRLQHARSFVTAPLFSRCPTLFATPRRSIIPQSRGV